MINSIHIRLESSSSVKALLFPSLHYRQSQTHNSIRRLKHITHPILHLTQPPPYHLLIVPAFLFLSQSLAHL
jgi:hypothetical protein